jgi:hypothetical protein
MRESKASASKGCAPSSAWMSVVIRWFSLAGVNERLAGASALQPSYRHRRLEIHGGSALRRCIECVLRYVNKMTRTSGAIPVAKQ